MKNCRTTVQLSIQDNGAKTDCINYFQYIVNRSRLGVQWYISACDFQNVAARDVVTVTDLGSLHQTTDNRQQVVDRVTTQLESELDVFAGFLDKVARRRPLRECSCDVRYRDCVL
jgi:hypothetical protein